MGHDVNTLPSEVLRLMRPEDRPKGATGLLPEERHEKAVAGLERELQAQIRGLLDRQGIAYGWSRTDKKTRGTVSWPDFVFALPGKPIAWECKMQGEKLRADQEIMRGRMVSNGWRYSVITSYEQALTELTALMGNQ